MADDNVSYLLRELQIKNPERYELPHLLELTRNQRFIDPMNAFLPQWKHCRDLLNRFPVRHEDWEY